LLLANLYYKHNESEENSFERVVNESCDIVDYVLLPLCKDLEKNKIKFKVGECDHETQSMHIEYLNCRKTDNDPVDIPTSIECYYIPYSSVKGVIIVYYSSFVLFLQVLYILIITK